MVLHVMARPLRDNPSRMRRCCRLPSRTGCAPTRD